MSVPFATFRSVCKSIFFQALGFIFLCLLGLALISWLTDAFSQTANPVDVEGLHQRFLHGVQLAQQGDDVGALKVFQGIIAESPHAKGSLYWIAFLYLQHGQADKALPFVDQLLDVDDSYAPMVLSIEANQALGNMEAVDEMRKKLFALRDGAREIHGLTDTKAYPRERLAKSHVEIDEFFDWKQDPFLAWEAIQRGPDHAPVRDILLAYNPDTKTFLFGENVIENGAIKQFNLYKRLPALPSYADFRAWTIDRLMTAPAAAQP